MKPRRLTDLGVDAAGLAWSPDGERLAFTADAHQRDELSYERADLWTVDLDGGVTRLTDDEYNYSGPPGRQTAAASWSAATRGWT